MSFIESLAWQHTLFKKRLNRFELLKLRPDWPCTAIRLRIHRNHGVEQVTSALAPFLGFSGFAADLWTSDYDDALSFPTGEGEASLVWMDFGRYAQLGAQELAEWFVARLDALRAASDGAIIVANDFDAGEQTPRVTVLDVAKIVAELGTAAFDVRREKLTATRLSDAVCLEAAREIGLRVLPEMFAPALKALAVDLDNTLYSGVLGEDGVAGVVLTEGHRALQEKLVELQKRGLLIAIVSKNELVDVRALFAERSDFPLRPELVSDWRVSWSGKAQGIREAAAALRIGADAFALIDDNLGELTSVATELPGVRLVYAAADAAETAATLNKFPGLSARPTSATDALRAQDLSANREREALAAKASDPMAYLKSLGVEIVLAMNPAEDRGRLAEMCVKTNQFNTAIARLNELDVEKYLTDPERRAVMVFMKDRLADSGSVASLFARREGSALVVDELCVSCRAMGRHLEDIMIAAAVQGIVNELPVETVQFPHVVGPRNQPARAWLKAFSGADIGDQPGRVDIPWANERFGPLLAEAPVLISWKQS
jgi:FkbH-like protein